MGIDIVNNKNSNIEAGVIRVRGGVVAAPMTRITRRAEVSEKALEPELVRRLNADLGLECLKYFNPNKPGYPDRLILLPGGRVVWVEVKSRGVKPRPMQVYRHDFLRRMGHIVEVVDSPDGITRVVNLCASMI